LRAWWYNFRFNRGLKGKRFAAIPMETIEASGIVITAPRGSVTVNREGTGV
jgi:hypothetical protein